MNALEQLTKARSMLILDHSFWGCLSCKLKLETSRCPSLATNGKILKYNPNFISNLSLPETIGVFAHEVGHCARGDQWRCGDRNHKLWNVAADYVLNLVLVDAGFTLPKGCLIDHQYRDMSTEEVYTILEAQAQASQQQGDKPDRNDDEETDDNGDGGQGGGYSDEQDKNETDEAGSDDTTDDETDNDGEGDQADDGEGKAEADEAGNQDGKGSTGSDGKPTDKPEDYPDPGGCGGVYQADEEDLIETEADWRSAVSQAAQVAHGDMPASIERMVEQIKEPPLPWHVILRDFVEHNARNDYNWMRPNRRYFGSGIVMPSLVSEELPEVVIAIDTSGSIDKVQLAHFAKEASAVLESYHTTARVIYCDSKVQGEQEFQSADMPMELEPIGGGGTNFEPVFEHVEKQGYTPCCLIYFTDMMGRFPKSAPAYPVLWLQNSPYENMPERYTPKFGEVVKFKIER